MLAPSTTDPDLGWKSIDVVRTKRRGAEARAFAIADDPTGETAEWDARS